MSNPLMLIIASIVGFIVFMFFSWRRLKDDYASSQIFSTSFYILIGVLAGFSISRFFLTQRLYPMPYFNPDGLWSWGSFLGFVVGFFVGIRRFGLKFFESIESFGISALFWYAIVMFFYSVFLSNYYLLMHFGFVVFLIFAFFILDTRYKTFTWYRSGRVGLAGLLIFSIYFLIRAIVAMVMPSMISFVGRIDSLISASVSFVIFLLIYNLSMEQ